MIDATPPASYVGQAPAQPAPVRARIERVPGGIHLCLIGEAARAVTVRYSLTLIANGNRARQSGTARLAPNTPATLLEITQSAVGEWHGILDLETSDGRAYHIRLADDL